MCEDVSGGDKHFSAQARHFGGGPPTGENDLLEPRSFREPELQRSRDPDGSARLCGPQGLGGFSVVLVRGDLLAQTNTSLRALRARGVDHARVERQMHGVLRFAAILPFARALHSPSL